MRAGVVVSAEPFEEAPQRDEVLQLAWERQRLPVLLPILEEPSLVTLEQRFRDLGRVRDRAFRALGRKRADIVLAVADRSLGKVAHPQPVGMRGEQRGEAARVAQVADGHALLALAFAWHGYDRKKAANGYDATANAAPS